MNIKTASLPLLFAVATLGTNANTLEHAQDIQKKTNNASISSQKKVDASAERALDLQVEIEQIRLEIKNLTVYRNHLSSLVKSQNNEMDSLEQQIKGVNSTRQGVVPLMYDMIDGLRELVASGSPIKLNVRQERVARLDSMMSRADVSDAEKYRRILDAYQIELDYGTMLEAYQGEINVGTETIQADIFHLGRISIVARSIDKNKYWSWDGSSNSWVDIDGSLTTEIDKAFNLVEQKSTSMVTLPVSLNAGERK